MTDKIDYPSCHFTAQSPESFQKEYGEIMAIAEMAKAIKLPSRAAKTPPVNNTAGLADARNKRDAAIRELSKLTGRSISDIQNDPKFAQKAKPTPVAAVAKTTPPAVKLTTAAAFAKPQMTMLRSEWQNLSNADKSRFFAEGGKLAQDPEPAKPLSKGGQLTREGLRALSPQAQNAYFAKGGRLAE